MDVRIVSSLLIVLVAERADALVLETSDASRAGSTPAEDTSRRFVQW